MQNKGQLLQKFRGQFERYFSSHTTSKYLLRTYFVYVFVALLMILTKVAIARFYGQEELGVYSYFFALGSFLFLWTSFEFPEALTQLIVKGKHSLRQVVTLSSQLILLTTVIVLSLLYFVDRFVYSLFADYPLLFLAFVLFVATYTIYYQLYSVLRGEKQFAKSSAFTLVWRSLFIIGIVLFSLFGVPFSRVLLFLSFCILVASVTMLPSFWKLWEENVAKSSTLQNILSHSALWKLAFALFLVQVGFYSLRTIDLYVLERLLSFAEVGYYSAYASFTNVIRMLAYVFPVVVLPMAAVSSYKIRKSLSRLLMLLLPFAALVLGATVFLVPLVYGTSYSGGFWLAFSLVVSSSLLLIYSYASSIFAGENDVSGKYFWVLGIDFLLSLVGNVVLNYYLILRLGIIGAPIATGIVVLVKIVFLLGSIKWLRAGKPLRKK